MTNPVITPEALFGEVRKNWGWLLGFGVVSLVLGVVGLGYSVALTFVGVEFFGWLMVITGAVELFQASKCRGWKSIVGQLLIAALHLAAGVLVISQPLVAGGVLTLFLAAAIFERFGAQTALGVIAAAGLVGFIAIIAIVPILRRAGQPGTPSI